MTRSRSRPLSDISEPVTMRLCATTYTDRDNNIFPAVYISSTGNVRVCPMSTKSEVQARKTAELLINTIQQNVDKMVRIAFPDNLKDLAANINTNTNTEEP